MPTIRTILAVAIATVAVASLSMQSACAAIILLDADTPATGSDLDISPLVTPYGTITFSGEIRDKDGDPEFDAAGALGNVFDIDGPLSDAELSFDFDVASFTFIYGGNNGVFDIMAFDASNVLVDSFFQADTDLGQPAGPVTLSGSGIRRVLWQDPGFSFAPIDNVSIETASAAVPEPATLTLWGLGALGCAIASRRRKRA